MPALRWTRSRRTLKIEDKIENSSIAHNRLVSGSGSVAVHPALPRRSAAPPNSMKTLLIRNSMLACRRPLRSAGQCAFFLQILGSFDAQRDAFVRSPSISMLGSFNVSGFPTRATSVCSACRPASRAVRSSAQVHMHGLKGFFSASS